MSTKQIKTKEIHHKYCDKCLQFQLGVCGGALYYVPQFATYTLCGVVFEKLKELENAKNQE